MKAQLAAGRTVVLLVSVCSSIYGWGADSSASTPITGSRGVVVSRAVVNFSELARRHSLLPATVRKAKVQPPEHERPARKPLPPGAIVKLAPEANASLAAPSAIGPPAPRTLMLSNSFLAEADNDTV